jgi:hypothetical protein
MEKDIDYQLSYEGDRIVAHGYINQIDGVNLKIKKTLPPDNIEANNEIPEAQVILIENMTNEIALQETGENEYILPINTTLINGADYSIKVSAPKLPEITSTKQILFDPIEIDDANIEGFPESIKKIITVKFTNPVIGNGYYIKYFFYLNDEVIETNDYSLFFDPYSIITPKTTGTQQYTFEENVEYYDQIELILYTLSEDIIQYAKSYDEYSYIYEDPFYDYIIPVHSNNNDGYGLFASYAYDRIVIF